MGRNDRRTAPVNPVSTPASPAATCDSVADHAKEVAIALRAIFACKESIDTGRQTAEEFVAQVFETEGDLKEHLAAIESAVTTAPEGAMTIRQRMHAMRDNSGGNARDIPITVRDDQTIRRLFGSSASLPITCATRKRRRDEGETTGRPDQPNRGGDRQIQ
ncbi:hypothetical protein ACHAQH_004915 [Verticillium albo-atrum]